MGKGQLLGPTQLLEPPSIMVTNTSMFAQGRGVLAKDPLVATVIPMCGTTPPIEIFS